MQDKNIEELEEKVIKINRVTKVVKGGKRLGFRAFVIVGDNEGSVGLGVARSKEVPSAIQKASVRAKKDITIIKSKYSVISNMLKGRIRKFHDLNLDDGIASIIYKTIERKEHLEELLGVKISEDIDLFEEFNLNKNTYNE